MKNKLILGNCEEKLSLIKNESIDCIITSPPYDNLRKYDNNVNINLISKELFRVIKNGGVCIWIIQDQVNKGCQSMTSFKTAINFVDNGWNLLDTMIWQKNGFTFPKKYSVVFII